jgi:hypothetical protein
LRINSRAKSSGHERDMKNLPGKPGSLESPDCNEARIVERIGWRQPQGASGWLPANWLLFLASQLIPNR